MKITYKVVSVSPETRMARGTVNGAEQVVQVLVIEVLLFNDVNGHLHFHFATPEERHYALKTFKEGASVVVTLPPEGKLEIDNSLPGLGEIDNELPPDAHIDHELPEAPARPGNALPGQPVLPGNALPGQPVLPGNELPGDLPPLGPGPGGPGAPPPVIDNTVPGAPEIGNELPPTGRPDRPDNELPPAGEIDNELPETPAPKKK
jgi:hypothetical protein